MVGIHVCLLLCLLREPRGVALYLGDGGDSGDENHNLLGDFTAADRSPTTRVFPDRVSGLIGRGALEVLKAWCKARTGRTPSRSDVAEERMRPCRARWGHDLSMGRLLEKLGPKRLFTRVRGREVLRSSSTAGGRLMALLGQALRTGAQGSRR